MFLEMLVIAMVLYDLARRLLELAEVQLLGLRSVVDSTFPLATINLVPIKSQGDFQVVSLLRKHSLAFPSLHDTGCFLPDKVISLPFLPY